MKNFINFFLFIVLIFIQLDSKNRPGEVLNRDYLYVDNSDYGIPYCIWDFLIYHPNKFLSLPQYLLKEIPNEFYKCHYCNEISAYTGYLDPDFNKYLSHLKHQLEYSRQSAINGSYCSCLWPEYSDKASIISDLSYKLFKNLISETALSNLLIDESEQKRFINNYVFFLNKHKLTISFIALQFRFSDYYHVCRDIEDYSKFKYREKNFLIIKDKIEDILECLYPYFFDLYVSCYKKHPSLDILREIQIMKLLQNDPTGFMDETANIVESFGLKFLSNRNLYKRKKIDVQNSKISKRFLLKKEPVKYNAFPFSLESEILLEQGTILNNLMLPKEAINFLSRSIQINSFNHNAYIERAFSYFETNQYSLAIEDYKFAKNLIRRQFLYRKELKKTIVIPENKIDFATGLCNGTLKGARISIKEFLPSICSCCSGILNGLWAFACSPLEIGQEMVNTTYSIGEFISTLSAQECFEYIVPELKELSISWSKADDYTRGHKIGYIIGKYGIDVFTPILAVKIAKLKAFKRANTICTLETYTSSLEGQAKILGQSIKHSSIRTKLVQKLKKGKILTKSSNVQYHVMQEKHAWGKLLKLDGNVEKDFKKVVEFLEEIKIYNKINLKETVEFGHSSIKLTVSEYRKKVNGYEIQAFFENYVDTGEVFLKNAWVISH